MSYKVYRRKKVIAEVVMYGSFFAGFVLLGAEHRDLTIQFILCMLSFGCFGICGLSFNYIERLKRRYRYYANRKKLSKAG